MINILHLETLAEVVRTGSFAAAARRIGYTASAVSQQMSALEQQVHLPLFTREAQKIQVTATGEFLASRSSELLEMIERLERDIQAISSGMMGRLRVGTFATASSRLLPNGLASFAQGHPQVEITLEEGEPDELLPLIAVGDLDVVLVYRYDLVPAVWPESLQSSSLLDEALLLLLPLDHPLSATTSVGLGQLAEDSWIATRDGTAGAECLARICASAGFAPRIAYRSNDYSLIQGLVGSGLGVAVVPALALDAERTDVRVLSLDLTVKRHTIALHRSLEVIPPLSALLSDLRETAEGLISDYVSLPVHV